MFRMRLVVRLRLKWKRAKRWYRLTLSIHL